MIQARLRRVLYHASRVKRNNIILININSSHSQSTKLVTRNRALYFPYRLKPYTLQYRFQSTLKPFTKNIKSLSILASVTVISLGIYSIYHYYHLNESSPSISPTIVSKPESITEIMSASSTPTSSTTVSESESISETNSMNASSTIPSTTGSKPDPITERNSMNTFNELNGRLSSKLSDEQWNEVCHELNKFGTNMCRAFQMQWYDYILVYGSMLAFGTGLICYPLWKYYLYRKNVKKLRIGRMKCRFEGNFRNYFFDVFLYSAMLTISTFGMYLFFGLSAVHESFWFDSHTIWYCVPEIEKKEIDIDDQKAQ